MNLPPIREYDTAIEFNDADFGWEPRWVAPVNGSIIDGVPRSWMKPYTLPYQLPCSIPPLDMVTIKKTSMFVLSPGALASMFRLPESGTPVIGPSWTFEVFPDPDNPDPVNKPEDGEEKEEEKAHEKSENGEKDKGGKKNVMGEKEPAEAPAEALAVANASADGSASEPADKAAEATTTTPELTQADLKLLDDEKAEKAKHATSAKLAKQAAMKGDLRAKRQSAQLAKDAKAAAAIALREEKRKIQAATRIQAAQRRRFVKQVVRSIRRELWARSVLKKGIILWRERGRRRLEELAKEQELQRQQRERRAQEAEARRLAKEEAARLKEEREKEEAAAPGGARRKAKLKSMIDRTLEEQKRQKQREKIALAAKDAARRAQEEVIEAMKRQVELREAALRKQEEDAKRRQDEKIAREAQEALDELVAFEEATAAVHGFVKGLQSMAFMGDEQREQIRVAGGIQPLVSMLSDTNNDQAAAVSWRPAALHRSSRLPTSLERP